LYIVYAKLKNLKADGIACPYKNEEKKMQINGYRPILPLCPEGVLPIFENSNSVIIDYFLDFSFLISTIIKMANPINNSTFTI